VEGEGEQSLLPREVDSVSEVQEGAVVGGLGAAAGLGAHQELDEPILSPHCQGVACWVLCQVDGSCRQYQGSQKETKRKEGRTVQGWDQELDQLVLGTRCQGVACWVLCQVDGSCRGKGKERKQEPEQGSDQVYRGCRDRRQIGAEDSPHLSMLHCFILCSVLLQ